MNWIKKNNISDMNLIYTYLTTDKFIQYCLRNAYDVLMYFAFLYCIIETDILIFKSIFCIFALAKAMEISKSNYKYKVTL